MLFPRQLFRHILANGLPDTSYPKLFVPGRFVPWVSITLTLTLALTLIPTPDNTNTNLNPRYIALTLLRNAGYETSGYEKVGVRNFWHIR